ncbi:hypothetical protein ERJ75_001315000 [Trypanosoma vivax]|nr:hypothetical protein ERJ75_001315000 [Trypanosoma vivax]
MGGRSQSTPGAAARNVDAQRPARRDKCSRQVCPSSVRLTAATFSARADRQLSGLQVTPLASCLPRPPLPPSTGRREQAPCRPAGAARSGQRAVSLWSVRRAVLRGPGEGDPRGSGAELETGDAPRTSLTQAGRETSRHKGRWCNGPVEQAAPQSQARIDAAPATQCACAPAKAVAARACRIACREARPDETRGVRRHCCAVHECTRLRAPRVCHCKAGREGSGRAASLPETRRHGTACGAEVALASGEQAEALVGGKQKAARTILGHRAGVRQQRLRAWP